MDTYRVTYDGQHGDTPFRHYPTLCDAENGLAALRTKGANCWVEEWDPKIGGWFLVYRDGAAQRQVGTVKASNRSAPGMFANTVVKAPGYMVTLKHSSSYTIVHQVWWDRFKQAGESISVLDHPTA